MMLRKFLATAFGFMCFSAYAQSIDAPALKAGDSWVYAETIEVGQQGFSRKDEAIAVERVDTDDLLIATKPDGSNQAPMEVMVGRDWSRSRDINGKQQIVNRPLEFPLHEGKKWTVDYTELNPNRAHSSESVHDDYVVVGWEDVEVPAGKFKALKIESQGQWSAVIAPAVIGGTAALATKSGVTTVTNAQRVTPHTSSGRLYKAFWYVPAEKRFVKSVEEYYDSKGVRSKRYTSELKSSKVSN